MQVELAQLNHLLQANPVWTPFTKGGIGMRGGEGDQREVDCRKIRERIDKIQRDLELVMRQRDVQRSGRKRNQWPLGSLLGYTNAKVTLFNAIPGGDCRRTSCSPRWTDHAPTALAYKSKRLLSDRWVS